MDTLRPGRGMADILPEALKAAGAKGVVVNHCEKPMSLPAIKATIDRAREIDFLVFACADSVAEARAIAQLHPDIINPEPTELIGGTGGVSDMKYVREVIRAIKEIDPEILVEQAAGITSGKQVYDFIMAGSEAAGAASGIMNRKGSTCHDRRNDRSGASRRGRFEKKELTAWFTEKTSKYSLTRKSARSMT